MTLLANWVASPWAATVGWTLLHSLWEGALIAATLAAFLTATRSPRSRYIASCAAMLIMLAGFAVTLARLAPAGSHPPSAPHSHAFPAWNVPADTNDPNPWAPGFAETVPWLAPFWLIGVLIFYLRQVVGCISVSRLRRRGVCCAPEVWQKELVRLNARLRVTRTVVLLESCFADAPLVLGCLRPVILMPLGLLAGLPAIQMDVILLHELAHIRRNDYFINVVQRSVEGLLFYHPAVWWISQVIRSERENCCDDIVVENGGNAHEYAVALTALEKNRSLGREPAVAATGGNLVKRIHRLLYPKPIGAWSPFVASAILIATTSMTLVAWQSGPSRTSPAPTQSATTSALSSSWSRWLNEEVVYIIADEERAAFLKLATDDERRHFVEQFWERRDPTPGSSVNVYKMEHYRRLAYANEHFATSRPGWQTDRGHMYIVYGPPDELEVHPKGAPRPSSSEIWLYHHIEGVGDQLTVTFVDRTGTGDYRLAPGNGH